MTPHSLFSIDPFGWLILDTALKATVLIAVGTGVVWLFARSSAALRHRIWALLFIALLLLPALGLAVPGWDWRIVPRGWQVAATTVREASPGTTTESPLETPSGPIASAPATGASVAEALGTGTPGMAATTTASVENNTQPIVSPTQSDDAVTAARLARVPAKNSDLGEGRAAAPFGSARPSGHWLAIAWLGGAFLALLPLALGLLANARLRRQSPVLSSSDWEGLLERSSRQVGLRRRVTLLSSGPRQMPMTFGIWRPCVALPADAADWSAGRRRIVLLHELAHIARRDVPLQMVARLACAVYWFHPLAWWALRQMRVEREHACDDHVLRAGQMASDYAAELLEIARAHSHGPVLLNAALSMARPSQLEGRLLAVLDAHRSRTPLGASWAGGLAVATLALVIALASVRPTLEAKPPSPTPSAPPDASQIPNGASGQQLVLTGVVLGPDGKPVPSATVEAIANDRSDGLRRRLPGGPGIEHYQTNADGTGHFRLSVPRDISRPRQFLTVLASDRSHRLATIDLNPRLTHRELELKLQESKTVRIQIVDAAGNPVPGVEPWLKYVLLQSGSYVQSLYHPGWYSMAAGWPHFSRSDERGVTSVVVPADAKTLTLEVDDEHAGAHKLEVDVTKAPASVALKSPRFLNGRVIDADNGQPIAGAEVEMMEEPFHSVITKADGSFRLSSGSSIRTLFREGESIIQVYPPPDSPNLFKAIEWKWPNEGIGDANLLVHLKRGQVVEGQVVEKGSGKPVAGASVRFDPQEYGNRYFLQSAKSRMSGSDMKYQTDAQGHFRLPVLPGPGYVLVAAPTLDYVHQSLSAGHRYYGKEGLEREYYDGIAKIRLTQGEHPEPLKIELERGVTLRRRVVLPDGKPVNGHAYARSYLQFKNEVSQWLPDIPIEDGLIELPGFDAAHSNPTFLLDRSGQFGATLSLTGSESRPIVLQSCGQARLRFVDEQRKPIPVYKPWLILVVTPGAPATHHIEPNQPLWVECVIWSNVQRNQQPVTDADGRVTFTGLLPGAVYRVLYTTKDRWTDGYEFHVRAGETTDVGEVVLAKRR
jgi:beta-lactamase regulating signal transducer with metallopeptidase domain/protocatechuate 3,4-dioxygenase beta subunit